MWCDNLISGIVAACRWVESGKIVYSSTFGHVPPCVYMSHRPNESFVPEQQRKYVSVVYGGEKMSDKNLEQRINIKFYVKIGNSASETLALLTVAYGEYGMKKSSVFEWHRRFKEGRVDVQDDPRSGQPKTHRTDSYVDRVRTLLRSDRRLGVRVIAEELNMNKETVRQIVKEDLGMRTVSAKMVPRILTRDQKHRRLHISSDLLRSADMFDRVITGDET